MSDSLTVTDLAKLRELARRAKLDETLPLVARLDADRLLNSLPLKPRPFSFDLNPRRLAQRQHPPVTIR